MDESCRGMGKMMRRMFELEIPEFGEFRTPLIDVRDLEDKLAIDIEIPGVEKSDIELKLTETTLEISARKKVGKEVERDGVYLSERGFSIFRRTMFLPVEVIPEKAEAGFDQGVLHIEVPKSKPESKIKIR